MSTGRGGPVAKTLRISHPAISGANARETLRFYTETLGMELVLRQPNLDYPSEEHLFFHVGDDNFIAYFVPKEGVDPATYEQARPGSGHMDHLAIDIRMADLEAFQVRLKEAGVTVQGPVDRGYERSIYFPDPNGVTIELLAWITEPPAGMSQAAIIRRAQQLREARGAAFIEDDDVRAAIGELRKG
ncbi:MAG: lactoylglutathione lyase [Anaerolinea sp.]|nr:lactoylglutathione lyase [Anaerolinea sp.]